MGGDAAGVSGHCRRECSDGQAKAATGIVSPTHSTVSAGNRSEGGAAPSINTQVDEEPKAACSIDTGIGKAVRELNDSQDASDSGEAAPVARSLASPARPASSPVSSVGFKVSSSVSGLDWRQSAEPLPMELLEEAAVDSADECSEVGDLLPPLPVMKQPTATEPLGSLSSSTLLHSPQQQPQMRPQSFRDPAATVEAFLHTDPLSKRPNSRGSALQKGCKQANGGGAGVVSSSLASRPTTAGEGTSRCSLSSSGRSWGGLTQNGATVEKMPRPPRLPPPPPLPPLPPQLKGMTIRVEKPGSVEEALQLASKFVELESWTVPPPLSGWRISTPRPGSAQSTQQESLLAIDNVEHLGDDARPKSAESRCSTANFSDLALAFTAM